MASEPNVLAIRPVPAVPSETDYQSFCATFSESARGSWFLGEYAKRNRNADTEVLLAALDRIEAVVRSPKPETGLRGELRVLRETMRLALPDIEQTANLSLRMVKLKAMLNLLERRLGSMIGEPQADEIATAAPAAIAAPEVPTPEISADSRSHLSVVPPSDEPELPIPSVTSEPPRAIALVGAGEPVTILAPAPVGQVMVLETAPATPWSSITEAADLTQIVEAALHIANDPDARGLAFPKVTSKEESDLAPIGWVIASAQETAGQSFVAFEIEQLDVEPAVSTAAVAQMADPADDILGPPERVTVEILKSPERPLAQPMPVPPPAPARQTASQFAKPQRAAADPLAPLRALSEEEVLALFS
jgi:hypothetical protein